MAIITTNPGARLDMLETYFASAHYPTLTLASSTEVQLHFPDNATDWMSGFGFTLDAEGDAISGTVNKIVEFTDGNEKFRIEGINLELTDIMLSFDEGRYDSVFSGLMSGSDVIYGGKSDDLIFGFTGDDTIIGGGGGDLIDGGEGIDIVVIAGNISMASFAFEDSAVIVSYQNISDTIINTEIIQFSDLLAKVSDLKLISEQYKSWANRVPGTSDYRQWIDSIEKGATSNDIKNFLINYDFKSADNILINALYKDYSGRLPNSEEVNFWLDKIGTGTSPDAIRVTIVDHQIGQDFAVSTVQAIYADFAGRAAAAGEVAHWIDKVRNSGVSYTDVRQAVIDHQIGQDFAVSTVQAIYADFAGRAAAAGEVAHWIDKVRNSGINYIDVRQAVIDHQIGQDFAVSTVQAIYADFAGRAAAAGEVAHWIDKVRNSGINYIDVRQAVIDHPIGQSHIAVRVDSLYIEYLGRQANGAEHSFWQNELHNGADFNELVEALGYVRESNRNLISEMTIDEDLHYAMSEQAEDYVGILAVRIAVSQESKYSNTVIEYKQYESELMAGNERSLLLSNVNSMNSTDLLIDGGGLGSDWFFA
jgi:Ca2+-binding RTX toxin-like protein